MPGEEFEGFLEHAPDGVFLVSSAGAIVFVNRQAEHLFGYSRDDLLGEPIEVLLPERFRDAHVGLRAGYFSDPRPRPMGTGLELYGRRADGSEFPVDISLSPLVWRGEVLAAAAVRDVTERKQAEDRIRRQLAHVHALRTIDATIRASLDLRVTISVFLDQVTAQLGVDAAAVLLLRPHTQALESAGGRGFRTTALQHTHLRVGNGYAGRAALERRIVSIPNLADEMGEFARAPLLTLEGFAAYYAIPLQAKGQVKGVLELFHRSPLSPDAEWFEFLDVLAGQAAIAIENATISNELQQANVELTLAYDATLEGWSRALELRERETERHTGRVTELAVRFARATGMRDQELVHFRRGALLHDIGKIALPNGILLKPGPLSEAEWDIMRRHPVSAYELLAPIAYLRPALDIPYCHHEKWDGSGYPRGLKGEEIPLAARIFAVADVWDSLLSDRPYRPAWPREKARGYIQEEAGKHFDPQLVEAFLRFVDQLGNAGRIP